ncbi:MAG TPA: hypothetical protein VKU00_21470 [Chthonomonadaceae bacterium]|nr:hypothetical protein [Chthonomonadaceae bacterium]
MIETLPPTIVTFGDTGEKTRRNDFVNLIRNCPIPDNELLLNMGLFLTPQTLSRILFMDFLYRQALEVQGVVMEFGCRWGQNVSLFSAMRGIYEPFNRLRKVVAFDTFAGLTPTSAEDGEAMRTGMYSVTAGYESYLKSVLEFQEAESPLSHLTKHEVVKGDATVQIQAYLERNPETIVALAYFDLDIYGPTVECLKAIKDRLTRGSVIGFDELNDHACPGETLAVKEVFGLDRYRIRRFPYNARTSYLVVE